jgi:hypothetical protein
MSTRRLIRSGVGANKVRGLRCARPLVPGALAAKVAARMCCRSALGSWEGTHHEIVDVALATAFVGGRHKRGRLDHQLENEMRGRRVPVGRYA